jgi:hypothetical protein
MQAWDSNVMNYKIKWKFLRNKHCSKCYNDLNIVSFASSVVPSYKIEKGNSVFYDV